MSSKKEDLAKKEVDKVNNAFAKTTGMKVVQSTPNVQGKTEYAKDQKLEK